MSNRTIDLAAEIAEANHRNAMQVSQRLQLDQQDNLARAQTNITRDPRETFSEQEQALIDGPRPQYSSDDLEADSLYNDLMCPLLSDVPEEHDMVIWCNHIFSQDQLTTYRQRGFPYRNPMTNAVLTETEFRTGDRSPNQHELENFRSIIDGYNSRQARRDGYNLYNSLQARIDAYQSMTQARERQQQQGSSLPRGRRVSLGDER